MRVAAPAFHGRGRQGAVKNDGATAFYQGERLLQDGSSDRRFRTEDEGFIPVATAGALPWEHSIISTLK